MLVETLHAFGSAAPSPSHLRQQPLTSCGLLAEALLSTGEQDRVREAVVARRLALWGGAGTAWWVAYGVVSTLQQRAPGVAGSGRLPLGEALRFEVGGALLWLPFTVAVVLLTERFPVGRGHRWALPVHVAGLVVAVVGRALEVVALNRWVGWYGELPAFPDLVAGSLLNNGFVYVLLTAAVHALFYAREHRRHEALLLRAELDALRAQVRPHFLFNTLNAIAALVPDEPARAERMISGLGTLLRRSLMSDSATEVPLRDELAVLRAYLDIERERFCDRLTVRYDVAQDTLDGLLPPLVLQPLAENAVRHGLWPHAGAGELLIRTRRTGGWLQVVIEDDGRGLPAPGEHLEGATGIGLATTRARLLKLYGARQRFEVAPRAGGGVTVTLAVPYHTRARAVDVPTTERLLMGAR